MAAEEDYFFNMICFVNLQQIMQLVRIHGLGISDKMYRLYYTTPVLAKNPFLLLKAEIEQKYSSLFLTTLDMMINRQLFTVIMPVYRVWAVFFPQFD